MHFLLRTDESQVLPFVSGATSMFRCWMAALIGCWLAMSSLRTAGADELGPAKDVPELHVLQHYHGDWEVTIENSGGSTGEVAARWILGGRYLEQSGVVRNPGGPNMWITTLFTFDTSTRKYRVWTFASNGSTGQAEMSWDAASKTMTSTARPDANGIRSTNTADFSTPGKERWHFRYTDRNGKQVGEMKGENTLRKLGATKLIPPKQVGELAAEQKPLERFIGRWKTEYTVPKAEWTPEEKRGSATMAFTRELGGQMVRERTTHADGTENTFLMLFDPQQKQYRAWWFSSAAEVMGQPNNSTGQWDEAAKAFTWKLTDANGITSSAQHRFEDEKLNWTVLVENPQKLVMFRMDGTSSRMK